MGDAGEQRGSALCPCWGTAGDQSHVYLAALGRDLCKSLWFAWSAFGVCISNFAL